MVVVPVATPITTPPVLTVAVPVALLDHVPPNTESLSEVVAETQTVVVPVMAAGTAGNGLTVTVAIATAVLHTLVTE